ncbi:hypothetical protein JCM30237_22870 [Halolamina litorea]|uniref:Integral membrane protein n=1 Tax=Halolamina litorea TaxID=1515593 RepID=A0ABD6BSQ1_9EURY|nr:hypothetical protein [Halolamina litorea]
MNDEPDPGGTTPDGTDLGSFGRRLAKTAAGLFGLAVLSLMGVVLELLVAADEPFVDEPTLQDPLSGWLFLSFLTSSGLSMLAYAGWSFREQRRLRAATGREVGGPLRRFRRTLAVLRAESDDLDDYERRVELTGFSLIVAGVLLALPLSVVWPA